MRVLVTGAGGQVGTDLVPLLLAKGAQVACLDVAPPSAPVPTGVEWIRGDVTVAADACDVVRSTKPEVVYHLAAILSASGERKPHVAWRVNLEGTHALLEAARLFGVRQVLFTSTIAAFGPGLPDPVPNEVSMRPTTIYGVTKVAGELLGEYYQGKWGLDFRGVRFPGLLTESEPSGGTSDYALLMYVDGVRRGAYEAFVRADSTIPLMYMPDAVRAMVELADAPKARLRRSIYNIAAMSPTAEEIAAAVRARVPGVRLTFRPDPLRQAILDSWPRRLDDSVAREEWGWRERFDLAAMSDDLIARLRGRAAAGGTEAPAGVRTPPAAPAPSRSSRGTA
jgi:threonine 3-dehydrogenase